MLTYFPNRDVGHGRATVYRNGFLNPIDLRCKSSFADESRAEPDLICMNALELERARFSEAVTSRSRPISFCWCLAQTKAQRNYCIGKGIGSIARHHLGSLHWTKSTISGC